MLEHDRETALALSFARRALALLDQAGESGPAIHLQRAIDAMTGATTVRTVVEAEAMLATPEALAIQRQLGWIDDGPALDSKPTSVEAEPAILFGRRLEEERHAAGLTQEQLSGRSGVDPRQIALVESGRADPTLDVMIDLAASVGAEVWDLLQSRCERGGQVR